MTGSADYGPTCWVVLLAIMVECCRIECCGKVSEKLELCWCCGGVELF